MPFILKMGHSSDVGKDKTKSTDVLEFLHNPRALHTYFHFISTLEISFAD